jgi:hypothetical protein
MYQRSTQRNADNYCDVISKEMSMRFLSPRKETLAFIVQFASAYHVEKKLPLELGEMILN